MTTGMTMMVRCSRRWSIGAAVAGVVGVATGVLPDPAAGQLQAPRSGLVGNGDAPFSVSLVANAPLPIRVGAQFRLSLSSSSAGYGSLYVLDPAYSVRVLAENLPLAAGSLSHDVTLVAEQPVGFNTVILLVTRQPFSGFSGNATLTSPVSLALGSRAFVSQLNGATRALPSHSWAVAELGIRVVG